MRNSREGAITLILSKSSALLFVLPLIVTSGSVALHSLTTLHIDTSTSPVATHSLTFIPFLSPSRLQALSGTQAQQFTLGVTSERIQSVPKSLDKRWLAAGTANGGIYLWNMKTNILIATLNRHTDRVHGLGWSPADGLLPPSSADGTVMVWKRP